MNFIFLVGLFFYIFFEDVLFYYIRVRPCICTWVCATYVEVTPSLSLREDESAGNLEAPFLCEIKKGKEAAEEYEEMKTS